MNAFAAAIPLLLTLLLVLASWEASASALEGADGRRGPRLLVRLALAAWIAGWVLWAIPLEEAHAALDALVLVPVSIFGAGVAGTLLTTLGGRLGARGRAPAGLRWLLAPYQGVVIWAHWLHDVSRARHRSQTPSEEPRAEPSTNGAAPADAAEGVRDLASLTVGEVMTPRSEVVTLEGTLTVREAIQRTRTQPHGVYPVFGETVEQPLGVVRTLDLAQEESLTRPVGELVRPIPIVPETIKCLALLLRLRTAPIPAAVVVDEYGSTAGFLTVEDLMEVLVGDLEGEHEIVRRRIVTLPDGRLRIEGNCRVDEFNAQIAPLLPEGEYETVAGAFLERFGRMPEAGDSVAFPELKLTVETATDRRIRSLFGERIEAPEED